jgi:hypothetical protein
MCTRCRPSSEIVADDIVVRIDDVQQWRPVLAPFNQTPAKK